MAVSPAIFEALAPVRSMLEADDYRLELEEEGGTLVARISAGPAACPTCLVPKKVMMRFFESALTGVMEPVPAEIVICYPPEHPEGDGQVSAGING